MLWFNVGVTGNLRPNHGRDGGSKRLHRVVAAEEQILYTAEENACINTRHILRQALGMFCTVVLLLIFDRMFEITLNKFKGGLDEEDRYHGHRELLTDLRITINYVK